jgi:16S rRNA (guanine527-N7)-methyltransferase
MTIAAEHVVAAAECWGMAEAALPAAEALASYGNLLLAWNARLNLTSIRDERQLIERHLLEGLFAALHQPAASSALDFGSGTGIPGIALAILNPKLAITLAESQRKKASFLREVVRTLDLRNTQVHAGRAEELPVAGFDAVWMRAVDRSEAMLPAAAILVARAGWICLLTSQLGAEAATEGLGATWQWQTTPLPLAERRVLHIGRRM